MTKNEKDNCINDLNLIIETIGGVHLDGIKSIGFLLNFAKYEGEDCIFKNRREAELPVT
jgi:hypothetical protein